MLSACRKNFHNVLPEEQLGQEHSSLNSFRKAINITPRHQKEFSLVVVTNEKRILLGLKHRGFGKGMLNSFGGKLEQNEDPVVAACRELFEETGISVAIEYMTKSKIGMLHFTFEDDPVEMVVHLFRVNVVFSAAGKEMSPSDAVVVDPRTIRGCDEITPEWIENFCEIPLHNMFADDSIWLTYVLSSSHKVALDGWFHFFGLWTKPTSAAKTQALTLEKRLFHNLHKKNIVSPSLKEFNEAWAFANVVKKSLPCNGIDHVIDVAGGHGALAAILLITTSSTRAVVVDPARVGRDSVRHAWGEFFHGKELTYRHECLRSGLPAELSLALETTSCDRILVVACHACQHLSDEAVEISCRFGVHVCVMPCCQKDPSPGSAWKAFSKNINFPIEKTMDILLAGKAMSWSTGKEAHAKYDVRMKTIDSKVTPQNRVIVCRSCAMDSQVSSNEVAHVKLQEAYKRAHKVHDATYDISKLNWLLPSLHLFGGFILGAISSAVIIRSRNR